MRLTRFGVVAATVCAVAVSVPAGGWAASTGTAAGTSAVAADPPPVTHQAAGWAQKSKARSARKCRSGNEYTRITGSGRSGGYALTERQWRSYGGREYAPQADQARPWQQDVVARSLVRDAGWSALACPTASWMHEIYAAAPGTPLGEMLIPGTHDSGSSAIDTAAPCDNQLIAGEDWQEPLQDLNPCTFADMYRAQGQNLGEQLRGGVRYLDLRVGVPADKVITKPDEPMPPARFVPLVLHHELVSRSLVSGLRQVLRFAENRPYEQVILDFQHVNLTGDPAIDARYIDALDQILRTYDPKGYGTICSRSWSSKVIDAPDADLGLGVPVRQAWRADRNLLVLFPDGVMPQRSCYRDRDAALLSLWPNTEDPQVSTDYNRDVLIQRLDRSSAGACQDGNENWCGLFVSQLQLTFQTGTFVACLQDPGPTCSLYAYSQEVNDGVADRFLRWRFRRDLPANIAMIDFYEDSAPDLATTLIRGNWRLVS